MIYLIVWFVGQIFYEEFFEAEWVSAIAHLGTAVFAFLAYLIARSNLKGFFHTQRLKVEMDLYQLESNVRNYFHQYFIVLHEINIPGAEQSDGVSSNGNTLVQRNKERLNETIQKMAFHVDKLAYIVTHESMQELYSTRSQIEWRDQYLDLFSDVAIALVSIRQTKDFDDFNFDNLLNALSNWGFNLVSMDRFGSRPLT